VDALSSVSSLSAFAGHDLDGVHDADRAYSASLELEIAERVDALLELDCGGTAAV
jgi:hypothetical protein